MRPFLKKASLFLTIGLIVAFLFQFLIDTGLKKSDYTFSIKEWSELYNSKINADILIQGSSKAKLQISPEMLEKSFNLRAYNIGIIGSSFPIQYYMFKEYLKYNRKPKYIIQTIDIDIFINPRVQFDFKQFIPYLNCDFLEAFKDHSIFTKKDLYIPLYKYSHSSGAPVTGLINVFNQKPLGNGNYNGFFSLDKHYDKALLIEKMKKNPKGLLGSIDPNVYKDFIAFIDLCHKENIKLILVWCPVLTEVQNLYANQDSIINRYSQTAKSKKIIFLNYNHDKICNDTSMFYDYNHLNTNGVKVFNAKLITDIKSKLQN